MVVKYIKIPNTAHKHILLAHSTHILSTIYTPCAYYIQHTSPHTSQTTHAYKTHTEIVYAILNANRFHTHTDITHIQRNILRRHTDSENTHTKHTKILVTYTHTTHINTTERDSTYKYYKDRSRTHRDTAHKQIKHT